MRCDSINHTSQGPYQVQSCKGKEITIPNTKTMKGTKDNLVSKMQSQLLKLGYSKYTGKIKYKVSDTSSYSAYKMLSTPLEPNPNCF